MAKRTIGALKETPKIEEKSSAKTRKIKVQLIGKISSATQEQLDLFAKAEEFLKAKGFEVWNPLKLIEGQTWEWYMKKCIASLVGMDFVFLLPSWQSSEGASIEAGLAKRLKIPNLEVWDVI
ncbi:MAG TPA: hypothetical protein DCS19_04130 [Flavobacterium sp.]|nr:hypothetical protein [Flavobacterium sp.]